MDMNDIVARGRIRRIPRAKMSEDSCIVPCLLNVDDTREQLRRPRHALHIYRDENTHRERKGTKERLRQM